MKGRKSIPSKIIQLRGGTKHTHQPPRDQEPQPPEKMPSCPRHLDKEARKEWRRAGKILQAIGLMTELDRAVFAGYCQAWSSWVRACVELAKSGPVYVRKDEDGKSDRIPRHNPWSRVMREADEAWTKKAVLLGLSPSSRASLKVSKPKTQNKAQKFRDSKNGFAIVRPKPKSKARTIKRPGKER